MASVEIWASTSAASPNAKKAKQPTAAPFPGAGRGGRRAASAHAARSERKGQPLRARPPEPASISDEAIAEYIRPVYKDTPPAYRAGRERFRRSFLQAATEEREIAAAAADGVRRFEKPTLVVWGCDDPWFSVSWGKKLADEIPGCMGLELIPFCGHWIPEEKPQVLAALIASHVSAAGTAVPPEAGAAK